MVQTHKKNVTHDRLQTEKMYKKRSKILHACHPHAGITKNSECAWESKADKDDVTGGGGGEQSKDRLNWNLKTLFF